MTEEKNFEVIPKISVIIPVFNAEKYLRQCLDSVLNQSLRNIEVICVDDGSTDSSLAILIEYKKQDPRITVIHQENLHAGIARNRGLERATGEYVHFLDADDLVADSDVYRKWYAIVKDNNADVCACERNHWNGEINTLIKRPSNFSKFKDYITMLSMEERPKDLIFGNCVPWNKLYRRDFLLYNDIRFDNLICANDRYFYFQVIFNVKRFFTIKEWWVTHRIQVSNSLTGETRAANYDCHFKAFSSIWCLAQNSSDEIKTLILAESVGDFLHWYRMAKGTLYEDDIKTELGKFLLDWDLSYTVNSLGKTQIADYLEIIENSAYEPVFKTISKIFEKERIPLRKELKNTQERYSKLLIKYNQIVNSRSYRLGRFLSFPYRKLKDCIKGRK